MSRLELSLFHAVTLMCGAILTLCLLLLLQVALLWQGSRRMDVLRDEVLVNRARVERLEQEILAGQR